MAQIVHSSLAPSEAVHYSLGSASFEVDGKTPFETDDPTVIANARAHPWLDVKMPEVEEIDIPVAQRLDPTKDPLSAQHPDARLAFDPDAIRAALAENLVTAPVAIDAGLDQDTDVVTGGVAETLASAHEVTDKAEEKIEDAESKSSSAKTAKEKK